MKNVTGQVAQGDDFFNRDAELAGFWSDLENDNLLLLAPRRVGKTSVLRRMEEQAAEKGFSVVFIDVSAEASEIEFVRRLYQEVLKSSKGDGLWQRLQGSWLKETIRRVTKLGGAGFSIEFAEDARDWSRLGSELADALSHLDGRWLVQIDELPVFVIKLLQEGEPAQRARAREFLYWLRRMRLEYPSVRWMLAGSIGLDTVTARLNLADAINDLQVVKLGAFSRKHAHELLCALGETYSIALPEPVREHLLTRIGWPIPYYLQLAFHELRSGGSSGQVTVDDVDRVFEALLDPAHRGYFDFWRQRLYAELGQPDSKFAMDLLSAVARDDEGVTRATLSQILERSIAEPEERDLKLRYLLDVLESDGYLVEHDKRWKFGLPLLRDFWRQRVAP
jgi:uncharacterized protein